MFSSEREVSDTKLNKGILAQNVCAKWSEEDNSDALNDITFEIKQGECYGICGSVGDGKVKVCYFITQH